ncbi:MAG: protein kinase [Myxococcota bacterium]|jgi:serine/threonine protein kinase|nr:protein kinase [Myxococcota bacterium]
MTSSPRLLFEGEDINEKYQLLSKIGSGGMGDIFLGIQRGAVDFSRLVVIKRIHSHLFQRGEHQQEERVRMFINEASLVASLNHPHIVKIYDFCIAGPSVAIVMEYVEGETLRLIRSGCVKNNIPLPLPLALRMILDACDAMQYAHDFTTHTGEPYQIIHRDIGLHNLMLDSNGYLKIIDFGIAKSTVKSDASAPGLIKGNPGYMAPDLFTELNPDHRIDIYALGLCLFELVTLRRAFRFESGVDFATIVQQVTVRELPPASTLVPNLPPGLDGVIAKAIHKKPDKRYQTVEEFSNALQPIAAGIQGNEPNLKKWFNQTFEKRVAQRREFGAKMSALAKKAVETSGVFSVNTDVTGTGMSAVSSVIAPPPSVSSVNPPPLPSKMNIGSSGTISSIEMFEPSSIYKLMGGMFLFFAACTVVVYLLFFRGQGGGERKPAIDNLIVQCDPNGALLSVNGRELGAIGPEGISLRVEPNQKHEIVISKKGYNDYVLPFMGPTDGAKVVNASLMKSEEEPSVAEVKPPDTNPAAVNSEMVFDGGNEPVAPASETGGSRPFGRRVKRPAISKGPPKGAQTTQKPPTTETPKQNPAALQDSKKRKIPLPDDNGHRIPILGDDDPPSNKKKTGSVPVL